MKIVVFDGSLAGVSGDMIVGALFDCVGAQQASKILEKVVTSIRIHTGDINFSVESSERNSGVFRGIRLEIQGEKRLGPGELTKVCEGVVNDLGLSPIASKYTKKALNHLLSAESTIHQTPIDDLHLHETGSPDTIFDICATMTICDFLGLFQECEKFLLPVAVGGGSVKTEHGTLPVPAPATLELLLREKMSFMGGPEDCELATPTGVSILASLDCKKTQFLPMMTVEKVGIGIGHRELTKSANCFRILIGRSSRAFSEEEIVILETNVDDVDGESLGFLFSQMVDTELVKDLSVIPTISKKNRPAHLVRAVCSPENADEAAKVLITELGSLGIRYLPCKRHVVARSLENIPLILSDGKSRTVPVKISRFEGEIISAKPEYEVIKQIALAERIPFRIVRKRVERAIQERIEDEEMI